ncbi:hypothetical protein AURDEDRAFT_115447 [Auricularia subglabra TFB-10046 SS5]|nr:hypothetical protein AURDEDRAFT_115447 [Auricularia subglabra TFB-10046 SS5]
MPRKRKRLKGFLADCARFTIKLTSVATDGVPVPGLKGAAGGASMLLDKSEARTANSDDEKLARDRAKALLDQLLRLSEGQLEPEQVEVYRRKIHSHLELLPDLARKSGLEQLVRADKYARDIVGFNTALDLLQRDIELELGRKSLTISQALHGAQTRQQDTLVGVVLSVKVLDDKLSEVQGSLVDALRQLPSTDRAEGVKRDEPRRALTAPLYLCVLFSTQGSQVPGWN